MKIEDVEDAAGLTALEPGWRALFEAAPEAAPFLAPEWLLPWMRTFLGGPPWMLAAREGGELAGLIGLYAYERPDGLRQLTLLGNGITDRLGLLARPGREAAVAAGLVEHLLHQGERWDCWDFRDLEAGSALMTVPLPQGWTETITPEEPCPLMDLPRDPGEVIRALPRKRRENLQRRARRLRELGALSFETADAQTWPRMLDALFRLHGARWREKGEAGVLDDPQVRAFHRAAAGELVARGLLTLHALSLDGRMVAVHYGLRRGARAYSYIHGFDPELAPYGPSALLIDHVMEEAVRAGARTFDFLRGREPYKYDWGAEDRPQHRRQVWKNGARPS